LCDFVARLRNNRLINLVHKEEDFQKYKQNQYLGKTLTTFQGAYAAVMQL